jgi:hypothetical protein
VNILHGCLLNINIFTLDYKVSIVIKIRLVLYEWFESFAVENMDNDFLQKREGKYELNVDMK